jgi:hypothetical protein
MASRVRATSTAILLASMLLVGAGGPVGAVPDAVDHATIARRGPCTGASTWRLRVVALPTAELRVRFTIVGGAAGETWNLFMDSDGIGFFAGSRVSDVRGLVSVRRRTADGPAVELIRATAHDVATGEICRGRVRARVDA